MAEYTYKDVIIDPDDPRAEVGKEYFFGDGPSHLLWGVRTGWEAGTLVKVCKDAPSEDPFYNGAARFQCIIRKKEPEKKYVPFDLSLEEDRAKLRGAWVKSKDDWKAEAFIHEFYESCVPEMICRVGNHPLTANDLFRDWTFLDGSPCGKLVEVEE